jgi:hypothetical protein
VIGQASDPKVRISTGMGRQNKRRLPGGLNL